MPPTTHKRILVLPVHGGWVSGFLDGMLDLADLAATARLPLLTEQGQALNLGRDDVFAIFYVSAFGSFPELGTASAAARRSSRQTGLWVRARLRDQRVLEGIVASDLLHIEAGLTLIPVYEASVWQRLWIPHAALVSVTPVEVLKPPRRRRTPQPGTSGPEERQFPLFEAGPSPQEERT